MNGEGDGVAVTPLGPPGDMPRIAVADQGRPYKQGYYCSMNPQPMGPPVMGGVVGAMFSALLRVDFQTGALVGYNLPPAHGMSETVHVDASEPGHEGWLVAIVDHETAPDRYEHAVWIWNAGAIFMGPVARVPIPTAMRPQVHGWWVPLADYEAARVLAVLAPEGAGTADHNAPIALTASSNRPSRSALRRKRTFCTRISPGVGTCWKSSMTSVA